MVELSNDEMKCIASFESVTGATVKDCLITDEAVAFIVKEGDLGRAIGRKGANITRVRQMFARQVLVFEDSENIEQFIRNLFGSVPVKNINIHEKMESKVAYVLVDGADRGAAIGKDGNRIKLGRAILQRRFGCDLRLVSK
ncbi:MAG: NusA-like transcription termination signal-binding factor [Candidatus Micrarchaeota archaeon]|nr:NusA-like transcription termination signal-binding factor [Candidatus Micrarchaeota archaeon]